MPYYHRCGGKISFWKRRCNKCGKTWSILAIFAPSPPKDMVYVLETRMPEVKRGKTKYASWADGFPGVSVIASRLPSWPRWVRIMVAIGFIGLIVGVIVWLI